MIATDEIARQINRELAELLDKIHETEPTMGWEEIEERLAQYVETRRAEYQRHTGNFITDIEIREGYVAIHADRNQN